MAWVDPATCPSSNFSLNHGEPTMSSPTRRGFARSMTTFVNIFSVVAR